MSQAGADSARCSPSMPVQGSNQASARPARERGGAGSVGRRQFMTQSQSSTGSLYGVRPFLPKISHLEAGEVSELDSLELSPEALARIQRRGIGREALEVEPVGSPTGQELPDAMAGMNRRTVSNQHHASRDFPQSHPRARRAGYWGLQRIAWHKQPTWRGWLDASPFIMMITS